MSEIIYQKSYQEYKAELDGEFQRTAEGFVRIGYLLKVARDTSILAESGYKTVSEFAEAEYNLNKTQVSRFISINDRFAEGGYSDRLQDTYKGFGYAKLTIMLQLPETLAEELTPEFTKSEIQDIKDELDEEKQVSDLEVLMEGEKEVTADVEDDLQKTVKQMGEDDPVLYADIWQQMRGHLSIEKMQEMLTPAGMKVYSVRIRGVGRKELILKDSANGNEIVIVDLRTSEKKHYTWEEMQNAWNIITAAGLDARSAWEATYYSKWPIAPEEKIAPVQPPKKDINKKRESKVQKASANISKESEKLINTPLGELKQLSLHEVKSTIPEPSQKDESQDITEMAQSGEESQEEQIPGQDNILNHPEWLQEKSLKNGINNSCDTMTEEEWKDLWGDLQDRTGGLDTFANHLYVVDDLIDEKITKQTIERVYKDALAVAAALERILNGKKYTT